MTKSQSAVAEAASRLLATYASGKPCDPVRDILKDASIEDAYRVQRLNTDHWIASGRRIVGKKIGLTSKAVQTQLGVNQPDFGVLFADMDVPDGEAIALDRILQPKVEAEIAFVLSSDLSGDHLTTADVIGAIDYAVAAIEIVGSRVRNWDITVLDTIADNASSGLFVLGQQPRKLSEIDLRLCGMAMERRGELVSAGAGAACLGSPLNAVLWLARTMASVGDPLKAGDVILSGALGPMVPVQPGDVFEARIEGLGSVRAAFAA
ncbi:2-keto-4-pentenoate hydratase [Ensifer adhaerens]|uniref:Fumarylacetoacetate hydrolase family protein n=1 Tax=Ensifer adhaerens TaxID=106592 RepID=A0A9Q8YGK3_ENSAD|nr:fumarylacetoacetate hydrolase family protein [Ensifer adhaerens]USJ28513.1 fumarylacetoacetate hydrolase family protein [Ensifer adhaerens]